MDVLRAGIIGAGCYGEQVLKELDRNENFQIVAVADRIRQRAEQACKQYGGQPYDDFRQLIVQEKFDVLVLALPTYLCGECITLACRLPVHIFKDAPLARSLPEATQWIQQVEETRRQFHIGSRKRFAPGYLQCRHWLEKKLIGEIYLVRAESFYPRQGSLDWRGDPLSAGGGVLMEEGYRLADLILWSLGSPEQVYCLTGNRCCKRVVPPYRTEDTAVLSMKYPGDVIASVECGWMSGAKTEQILWYGTEGTLLCSPNLFIAYDMSGAVIHEDHYAIDDAWQIAQQIRHFSDCIRDDQVIPVSTAREHLANVAVIESAYLSAKTQLPEKLKVYGKLLSM